MILSGRKIEAILEAITEGRSEGRTNWSFTADFADFADRKKSASSV